MADRLVGKKAACWAEKTVGSKVAWTVDLTAAYLVDLWVVMRVVLMAAMKADCLVYQMAVKMVELKVETMDGHWVGN